MHASVDISTCNMPSGVEALEFFQPLTILNSCPTSPEKTRPFFSMTMEFCYIVHACTRLVFSFHVSNGEVSVSETTFEEAGGNDVDDAASLEPPTDRPVIPDSACIDRWPNCEELAAAGRCEDQDGEVMQNCVKTCLCGEHCIYIDPNTSLYTWYVKTSCCRLHVIVHTVYQLYLH